MYLRPKPASNFKFYSLSLSFFSFTISSNSSDSSVPYLDNLIPVHDALEAVASQVEEDDADEGDGGADGPPGLAPQAGGDGAEGAQAAVDERVEDDQGHGGDQGDGHEGEQLVVVDEVGRAQVRGDLQVWEDPLEKGRGRWNVRGFGTVTPAQVEPLTGRRRRIPDVLEKGPHLYVVALPPF